MQSVLWSLEHVSLGADDRRRLDDVSVSILPGRTAVLGESGAGKTSLLNLLVEFDRPTRGTIQSHVGPNLSWVPPDHGLWPRSTVRQHLEAVCPGAVDANSSVDHWLKSFALESVAKRYPSTLSMGERSRLAVARSLASQAVAYVMDEPLANVDSARLPEFWSVLRESLQQTESSLVFATHSAETVLAEADQVICLDGGRLVWQGAVRELYDSPPDERTARFLGPVNWFEGIEAATWLEGLPPQKTCYRPEQLAVLPDESGKAVVEEVRFAGSLEEVRLGSMDNSLQKTVYH
ncbi:MAG: ATP-binding cassette domain-containing protein, partial [Planctomycetaceae bacterium]|nr:ATP-binding cassette domain-containing protein [Planctomycetaceae bacterium]